jgi:hypothetical protein
MKGTKVNRDRKNGSGREQWRKRKAAANAARPAQDREVVESNGEFIRAKFVRTK